MRWGAESGKWRRWFAWYPVRLSTDLGLDAGQWVWLEVVERKRALWYGDDTNIYRPCA